MILYFKHGGGVLLIEVQFHPKKKKKKITYVSSPGNTWKACAGFQLLPDPRAQIRIKGPVLSFQLPPSNFWSFFYHKKAHIFLVTHVKFHSWKVMRLEDIKVSGYGIALPYKWGLHNNFIGTAINIQSCLPNPNGLTNSNEILDLYLACDCKKVVTDIFAKTSRE